MLKKIKTRILNLLQTGKNNSQVLNNNIIIKTISYCNVRYVWCPMKILKNIK